MKKKRRSFWIGGETHLKKKGLYEIFFVSPEFIFKIKEGSLGSSGSGCQARPNALNLVAEPGPMLLGLRSSQTQCYWVNNF
jgi:hypothetical protein